LLIFVALSFWLDDTTLRSTLIGGVVANAGAAVAFYFASKSSDQARRDILGASLPSIPVPDLAGKNLQKVRETLAATALRLEQRPPAPVEGAQVLTQFRQPIRPRLPVRQSRRYLPGPCRTSAVLPSRKPSHSWPPST